MLKAFIAVAFVVLQCSLSEASDDGKCTPGTRWMEDCNNCWCTETGLAACTLKGCIPADASSARNAPKPADKSNLKVFTEAEFSDESFKCQPGENFMVDCNMCRCADGKQARCSKKRCVPGEV